MSDIKLTLSSREITGKKLSELRKNNLIPSVIYGGAEKPILTQSAYNETEKAIRLAGYHSTLDLDIDGKTQLGIIKSIDVDPVSRKFVNIEFQAVSADEVIAAITPIVIEGFEQSEATKLHYVLSQVMEEIEEIGRASCRERV